MSLIPAADRTTDRSTSDRASDSTNKSARRPWLTDDGRFRFGKYRDEPAESVVRNDPSYIGWVLETVDNMVDDDRAILIALLRRFG